MKFEIEMRPTTELPKKSGEYLAFVTDEAVVQIVDYSEKYKTWYAFDEFDKEIAREVSIIAWAEIPTKEESLLGGFFFF